MNWVMGGGSTGTMRLRTVGGHIGIDRLDRRDRAVEVISHVVQARHVHALDLSQAAQRSDAQLRSSRILRLDVAPLGGLLTRFHCSMQRAISTMTSSPSPITKASMKSAIGSGL